MNARSGSALRVLGPVRLEAPAGRRPDRVLRQPKQLALLTYLAMHSEGVSRDRVTAIFWPEAEASRARASLRQYLSRLRRALGESLITRDGMYGLGVDPSVLHTDVLHFREAMTNGEIEGALDLYRGSFLDGFFVDRLHEFDEWAERTRFDCQTQAADGAWTLARQAAEQGEVLNAAFWAKRSLALAPFEESRVSQLMQFLDQVGDRTGALRLYRGLEDWLRSEFEAEPSPETQRLHRHILQREEAADVGPFGTRRVRSDRRDGPDRRTATVRFQGVEKRSGEARRVLASRRKGGDRRRRVEGPQGES